MGKCWVSGRGCQFRVRAVAVWHAWVEGGLDLRHYSLRFKHGRCQNLYAVLARPVLQLTVLQRSICRTPLMTAYGSAKPPEEGGNLQLPLRDKTEGICPTPCPIVVV